MKTEQHLEGNIPQVPQPFGECRRPYSGCQEIKLIFQNAAPDLHPQVWFGGLPPGAPHHPSRLSGTFPTRWLQTERSKANSAAPDSIPTRSGAVSDPKPPQPRGPDMFLTSLEIPTHRSWHHKRRYQEDGKLMKPEPPPHSGLVGWFWSWMVDVR